MFDVLIELIDQLLLTSVNLSVQTRKEGKLRVSAENDLRLLAKSASLTVSSLGQLALEAPKLVFDSDRLEVRGIQFLEMNSESNLKDATTNRWFARELIAVNGFLMAG